VGTMSGGKPFIEQDLQKKIGGRHYDQ